MDGDRTPWWLVHLAMTGVLGCCMRRWAERKIDQWATANPRTASE